jgi:hypothetical protein
MKFYQHPLCLLDNLDLILNHEVFIAVPNEEGGLMGIYGPSHSNNFVIDYSPSRYGSIVVGESTIQHEEPFYMNHKAVVRYLGEV